MFNLNVYDVVSDKYIIGLMNAIGIDEESSIVSLLDATRSLSIFYSPDEVSSLYTIWGSFLADLYKEYDLSYELHIKYTNCAIKANVVSKEDKTVIESVYVSEYIRKTVYLLERLYSETVFHFEMYLPICNQFNYFKLYLSANRPILAHSCDLSYISECRSVYTPLLKYMKNMWKYACLEDNGNSIVRFKLNNYECWVDLVNKSVKGKMGVDYPYKDKDYNILDRVCDSLSNINKLSSYPVHSVSFVRSSNIKVSSQKEIQIEGYEIPSKECPSEVNVYFKISY